MIVHDWQYDITKEGLNDDTEVLDEFCIVPMTAMTVTAKQERENWLEF